MPQYVWKENGEFKGNDIWIQFQQAVQYFCPYSSVGGEFPLPIITQAPSLVTSLTVRNTVAGPGG